MTSAEIDALKEDPDFYVDCGSGVWLMDDHKWAFYVWHRFRAHSGIDRFSLVHADYHWDGGSDFSDDDGAQKLLAADDKSLLAIVKDNSLVRYDSFISPAVLRGYFGEIHFYCKQGDDLDEGIDPELLERTATEQTIHEELGTLVAQEFSCPIIFDLCLDLFNKESKQMYQGDIWSEEEVKAFLSAVRPIVQEAELVTLSLSFGYSGTEADTRKLAKLVLPTLLEWRQQPDGEAVLD